MKFLTFIFALFVTSAFAEGDYRARFCEIYVPEVSKAYGPFHAKTLAFHVNIKPERLDSEVKEVGFLYKGIVRSKEGFAFEQFLTERARRFNDYQFLVTLPLSHDDASLEYIGSFYVKTKNNTVYWLNDRNGQDFTLNEESFTSLIPAEFNPDHCF